MRHSTLIHERVEQCRAGRNEKAICRISSGWVVLGDVQFLRGYSLLLADPVVPSLNHLDKDARKAFLYEMSLIGDVLLEITGARLINYELLGNMEFALHAHLFPRFENEPAELKHYPAWFYDKQVRAATPFDSQRDKPLMDAIRSALDARELVC